MKISIYVAHHKMGYIFTSDIFVPIHVGSSKSDLNLKILRDCKGDNISAKNQFYCELTAAYWAWKNDKQSNYIGLCHYRRYFSLKGLSYYRFLPSYIRFIFFTILGNVFMKRKTIALVNQIEHDKIQDFVKSINGFESYLKKKQFPIITTYPIRLSNRSVEDAWSTIGESYIYELKQIINSKFPDYKSYLEDVMLDNRISICNMFIFRRDIYEEYCNFLFAVLAEHEKLNIDLNSDSNLAFKGYRRVPGFLGEILTNVFIKKYSSENKIKLKYVYNSKISDLIR